MGCFQISGNVAELIDALMWESMGVDLVRIERLV